MILIACSELDHSLSATKIARESREGSFKLGALIAKIFIRYEQHSMLSQFQQAIQNKTVQGIPDCVCYGGTSDGALAKRILFMRFTTIRLIGTITNGEAHSAQPNGWARYSFDLRSALLQAVELSLEPNLEWLGQQLRK